MGKFRSRFLFSIMVLAFWSTTCTNSRQSPGFTISGKITGINKRYVILEEITPAERIKIDSMQPGNDGKFHFSYLPDQPGIFALVVPSVGLISFYADENSRLTLTADFGSTPGKYSISGNKGSEMLQKYYAQTSDNQQILDSLSLLFSNSQHLDNFYQIKTSLDSSFAELFRIQQDFTTRLLTENPSEIASLLLLNQYFGNTRLLVPEIYSDIYFLLDSHLVALYPENRHVQEHHQRVTALKASLEENLKADALVGKGMNAPDFSLPDTAGTVVSLSSLKGKTVIVFFWASWSPPCRAVLQQIKQFTSQNKDSNIQVLAVSFDHNGKFWKAAIETENTPWINVSDLRGFYSPVKKLYNVPDNLPYFYLIDNEGKILEKSAKLSEILKILG